MVARRRAEADEFYQAITPPGVDAEGAMIMRRALAGMLWSKQFYYFDLDRWLQEHEAHPLRDPKRADVRNRHWFHMQNGNILSMPDCWEYPWYAAWDLAFHCVPLSMVDPAFTRQQIELILSDVYLHPSGQIPAYEWNFGDVNPPVHAWATLFAYTAGAGPDGEQQTDFLRDAFKKLMLNFSWWLNRKDPDGKNLFEGGFLGLDNIGVFDRSAPLPTGGHLEQADGTAWMAMFSQNMLDLALILPAVDPSYEDLALRFVQHFFWIASGMDRVGQIRRRDVGRRGRLLLRRAPPAGRLGHPAADPLDGGPDPPVRRLGHPPRGHRALPQPGGPGPGELRALRRPAGRRRRPAWCRGWTGGTCCRSWTSAKLRRVLSRMLDEERFLSPHGIRSLSRSHLDEPFVFTVHGQEYRVQYLPAESDTAMFGGNSNWRGPVWFPINLLIVRALLTYYLYYGDDFTIECPTGSGQQMTLYRGGQGDLRPPHLDLPARRGRPPARLRRDGHLPGRPALARPAAVPRVLPRRQRGGDRGQPPDGLDRRRGPPHPALRLHRPGRDAARAAAPARPRLPATRGLPRCRRLRPHRRRCPAGRDHRRLTAAAVTRFRAVAAPWHAVLAGRRMLAMSGPMLAMIMPGETIAR